MDIFPYCPPEVKFSDIRSNCFLDTLAVSILTGFIVIFGFLQLIKYWRYAKPVSDTSSSMLYYFQIILLTIIPSLSIVDVTHLYGYTFLVSSLTCLSFLMSIWLVLTERSYLLPLAPERRHSTVLLIFWSLFFINENISIIKLKNGPVFVIRYVCSLLVVILGLLAPGIESNRKESCVRLEDDKTKAKSTWTEQWNKFKFLVQHFWPRTNTAIQLTIVCIIFLLIIERFIVALIPVYDQKIVDGLGEKIYCWDMILVLVGFKFLQRGFLNHLHSYLWRYVDHFMSRQTESKIFTHIQNLSLRWHLARKTGDAITALDRSGDTITGLMEYTILWIGPRIIDIISSIAFISVTFGCYFGLILIVPMSLYLWLTVVLTEWINQYKKSMNSANSEQRSRCIDSLLNFETVKYCGTEKYEAQCFCEAITKCQNEERKFSIPYVLLDIIQEIIIHGSLLGGSLFWAYLVVDVGSITTGQYIFFVSHIYHLYYPFNDLVFLYKYMQAKLVDAETLFDLLEEKQEVVDAPDAVELPSVRGKIEFKNVTFGYMPEEIVLKNVSFSVPVGKTVAIVGPSGAGKSTIIRLLFRFYDVLGGSICIDGHDIKGVKQDSLRQAIGVVPQDTILFNSTIKHNIKYSRLNASDDEVIEAARAAEIHEKIMKFSEKYETEVGERGLRLSSGEKQRVAIAPSIMLLDEATSALDTQTERNIQSALAKVCANRTTVIVAHRLSTVIHADEILVMKDGEIMERGRHNVLLDKKGIYADMWNVQNDANSTKNDIGISDTHQKAD
ncbi:ATP-binding cassette sub-family B member 6-like isoform X2 [Sitodiplosis mosellana]|uniref:ATP-binding cassette sub-family B member 6-like isoform X2 n=1 Tax=Sitodiplosis mosellana TaxID=263140 RepID=UPI0024440520|nr:ATP-binding cassette sub-family B member 6-like isoform X2 [Sitodiplosis mosellana]